MLLYQLLVGALPLDLEKLAFHEILRQVCERDAPKPSTRVRTLGEESSTAAANRSTDPPSLVRQLRGDLDAIALKALAKERNRRYSSPSDLAADLQRFLDHQPVVAHAPNAEYRVRKYVRRHRFGVVAVAALVMLSVGFTVMQAVELGRIRRERDRADRITRFMTDMFKVADPNEARGNQVTAREILDRTSRNISASLGDDRDLQAQLMQVMGRVYVNLGLYREADRLFRQALNTETALHGALDPATLAVMNDLAGDALHETHYAEAVQLGKSALEEERRRLGATDPQTLGTLSDLANAYTYLPGRTADAIKIGRELLAVQKNVTGPQSRQTARAMMNLGRSLSGDGQLKEAEELFRSAWEIFRSTLGSEDSHTVNAQLNLGATLDALGRFQEAEKMQREAIAVKRKVLGSEHPETLWAEGDLANTLINEGKFSEVVAMLPPIITAQERVVGPEHISTLNSLVYLAAADESLGRYAEAEKLLKEAADRDRHARGAGSLDAALDDGQRAVAIAHLGRYAEAEHLLQGALKVAKAENGPYLAELEYREGAVDAMEGHADQAIAKLQEALKGGLPPADSASLATDPEFRSLRNDKRFRDLIASIPKAG